MSSLDCLSDPPLAVKNLASQSIFRSFDGAQDDTMDFSTGSIGTIDDDWNESTEVNFPRSERRDHVACVVQCHCVIIF